MQLNILGNQPPDDPNNGEEGKVQIEEHKQCPNCLRLESENQRLRKEIQRLESEFQRRKKLLDQKRNTENQKHHSIQKDDDSTVVRGRKTERKEGDQSPEKCTSSEKESKKQVIQASQAQSKGEANDTLNQDAAQDRECRDEVGSNDDKREDMASDKKTHSEKEDLINDEKMN